MLIINSFCISLFVLDQVFEFKYKYNLFKMKTLLVKLLLVVPALLFLDWVIMVVVGSVSNILGANDKFFCTFYCDFGIALLVSTFLFIAYFTLKQNFRQNINI